MLDALKLDVVASDFDKDDDQHIYSNGSCLDRMWFSFVTNACGACRSSGEVFDSDGDIFYDTLWLFNGKGSSKKACYI